MKDTRSTQKKLRQTFKQMLILVDR